MIVGRKVRLRTPDIDGPEHRLIVAWRNDPRNRRWFLEQKPFSLESHLVWYAGVVGDDTQRFYVVDALVSPGRGHAPLEEPVTIGTIGLNRIDWDNHSAERGRQLIGRPEFRGRGFGSEMGYLMLHHAFNDLELHRIWVEVLADNEVMLRIEREVGFTMEGVLREHVYRDGRYVDLIRFGLLADEFRARQPALREKLGLSSPGGSP